VGSDAIAITGVQGDVAPQAQVETRLLNLFETHHRRLYVLARRLTRSPNDAEDVVQDTFLRVARSSASLPYESSEAEAWLVRILVNVCRDRWRVQTGRRRLETHFDTPNWTPVPGDPEAALIAQTTIWAALEQLVPRRRAVIVLHELEGLDVPQIARLLRISPVTIRWHLSRGRRELAAAIESGQGGRR
jgi:RNA polymerase sigma-70 factor (ECF subfamily)